MGLRKKRTFSFYVLEQYEDFHTIWCSNDLQLRGISWNSFLDKTLTARQQCCLLRTDDSSLSYRCGKNARLVSTFWNSTRISIRFGVPTIYNYEGFPGILSWISLLLPDSNAVSSELMIRH